MTRAFGRNNCFHMISQSRLINYCDLLHGLHRIVPVYKYLPCVSILRFLDFEADLPQHVPVLEFRASPITGSQPCLTYLPFSSIFHHILPISSYFFNTFHVIIGPSAIAKHKGPWYHKINAESHRIPMDFVDHGVLNLHGLRGSALLKRWV